MRGPALAAARPVPFAAARAVVPPELRLLPVLPGRAAGVLILARYEEGSALHYSELAVLVGPVARGGRLGGWVHGMWVDSPVSRAGGRALWGVPKELARFDWSSRGAEVHGADGRLLAAASWTQAPGAVPLRLGSSFFGAEHGPLRRGPLAGRFAGAPARAELTVPGDGPFAEVGLGGTLAGWAGRFDGAAGPARVLAG